MPLPNLQQLKVISPQPATMRMQGMQMLDQLERTGIAKDRNAIAREGLALNEKTFEFNAAKATFEKSRDFVGDMGRNEVSEYKDWLSKIPHFGELAGLLPDQQELFEMSEEDFVAMKERIEIGTDNVAKMDRLQLEETIKTIREDKKRTQKLKDDAQAQRDRIALKKTPPGTTGGDPKPSALEKKIEQIKAAYPGMSDQKARRIATGTIKVITDPFSGTTTLVDVGTGETIPMKQQTVEDESVAQKTTEKPKQTLWDMSELATGPISAGLAAMSVPSGVVGGPVAEKTIRARQFMSSAQNDLIRALSINPRFPVGEIKRLQKEINISPSVVDNPKMMRSRMEAVNDYLHRRLEKEKRVASDSSYPIADRKAASSASVDIEQFLRILGVPEDVGIQGLSKEDQSLIDKYK